MCTCYVLLLVCAAKLVCPLVCASKLLSVFVCALKLVCAPPNIGAKKEPALAATPPTPDYDP